MVVDHYEMMMDMLAKYDIDNLVHVMSLEHKTVLPVVDLVIMIDVDGYERSTEDFLLHLDNLHSTIVHDDVTLVYFNLE